MEQEMTSKEFKEFFGNKRAKSKQIERDIQISCINWFRATYPQYYMNLFAVGNGGSRNAIEGANLKRSGVLAGVSDVIFLKANKQFNGACIEFKKDYKAKQTESQKNFEIAVTMAGYLYEVVCSFEQFEKLIKQFLS